MTFLLGKGRKRIIIIYSIDNQLNTYTNKYVLLLICICGKDSFLYIGNHRKFNELYPTNLKKGTRIFEKGEKLIAS
jgi:hypothetical protein